MTIRDLYLRAARTARDYNRALARLDALDLIRARRAYTRKQHKWKYAHGRVLSVSLRRRSIAETARLGARDRMLLDPWEEAEKHSIAVRFAEISAARRKGMS